MVAEGHTNNVVLLSRSPLGIALITNKIIAYITQRENEATTEKYLAMSI
jgi:hypothetical protein